ncbi:hypothetical protein [Thiolapillus sp.]
MAGSDRWRSVLLAGGTAGMALLAWFIHITQPIGAVNVEGLTYWGGHWSLFIWHSLFCLCIALVVLAAALGLGVTDRLLANRVIMYLGIISYSL